MVSFGQVGDLPGTRAGGQDDVSSHKLPQIMMMMMMMVMMVMVVVVGTLHLPRGSMNHTTGQKTCN